MVNGTSTMTGIAALVVERAWRILSAAVYATAFSVHALKGNAQHYHPVIAQAKPFPGQAFVARSDFSSFTDQDIGASIGRRCSGDAAGSLLAAAALRRW